MGAAMQLSAVTSFLTANVAAIPLLWILPLSVYLITIIIAFQFPRRVPPLLLGRFLIVILASLGYCALPRRRLLAAVGVAQLSFWSRSFSPACSATAKP